MDVATENENKLKGVTKLHELTQCIPTILQPAAQSDKSSCEVELKRLEIALQLKQEESRKHRDALTEALTAERKLKEESQKQTTKINDIAVIAKLLEEVQIKNKKAAEGTIAETKSKIEQLTIRKNTKEVEYNSQPAEDMKAETSAPLKEEIDKITQEISDLTASVASMEKTVSTFGKPPKGIFAFFK